MFLKQYLYVMYFFDKINFCRINNYYEYKFNEKDKSIKVNNITLLYYISCLFFFSKIIFNFFNFNVNNIIVKTNNKYILLKKLEKFQISIPKGIIDTIELNIKNHRYELNNLKLNYFNVDKSTPLIFCLAFFENIKNIESCFINCNYKTSSDSLKEKLSYKVSNLNILADII